MEGSLGMAALREQNGEFTRMGEALCKAGVAKVHFAEVAGDEGGMARSGGGGVLDRINEIYLISQMAGGDEGGGEGLDERKKRR